MKKSIGVCGDSRRDQRDQRTHRRGSILQRYFVKKVAINVCVKGGICLNQVGSPALHRDSLSRTAQFQTDIQARGNDRANIYILRVWSESLDANGEMVRIERDVGNGKSARAVR